ncbi:MAG: hypothetical protein ACHRHE_04435 [Tepidisphaerales bacterium]
MLHERVQFSGALNSAFEFNPHVSIRVLLPVRNQSGSNRLQQRVLIRQSRLPLISQAPVEVVSFASFSPERHDTLRQQIIDQLGNRAVERSHEGSEVLSDSEVTDSVIVVHEERCDPWDETEVSTVVIEAIPEYTFGLRGLEREDAISGLGGDEIDSVIAIPVLEAVVTFEEFGVRMG